LVSDLTSLRDGKAWTAIDHGNLAQCKSTTDAASMVGETVDISLGTTSADGNTASFTLNTEIGGRANGRPCWSKQYAKLVSITRDTVSQITVVKKATEQWAGITVTCDANDIGSLSDSTFCDVEVIVDTFRLISATKGTGLVAGLMVDDPVAGQLSFKSDITEIAKACVDTDGGGPVEFLCSEEGSSTARNSLSSNDGVEACPTVSCHTSDGSCTDGSNLNPTQCGNGATSSLLGTGSRSTQTCLAVTETRSRGSCSADYRVAPHLSYALEYALKQVEIKRAVAPGSATMTETGAVKNIDLTTCASSATVQCGVLEFEAKTTAGHSYLFGQVSTTVNTVGSNPEHHVALKKHLLACTPVLGTTFFVAADTAGEITALAKKFPSGSCRVIYSTITLQADADAAQCALAATRVVITGVPEFKTGAVYFGPTKRQVACGAADEACAARNTVALDSARVLTSATSKKPPAPAECVAIATGNVLDGTDSDLSKLLMKPGVLSAENVGTGFPLLGDKLSRLAEAPCDITSTTGCAATVADQTAADFAKIMEKVGSTTCPGAQAQLFKRLDADLNSKVSAAELKVSIATRTPCLYDLCIETALLTSSL
jgi:hypothetical protein